VGVYIAPLCDNESNPSWSWPWSGIEIENVLAIRGKEGLYQHILKDNGLGVLIRRYELSQGIDVVHYDKNAL